MLKLLWTAFITTSPRNQRIEANWSILKRDRIGWWHRFLQDLSDLELFSRDDPVIVDCARFCFIEFIRDELQSIMDDWNVHIISQGRSTGPRGRPDTMYFLPHLYDTIDYATPITEEEVNEFRPSVSHNLRDYSKEFEEFANLVMLNNNLNHPSNVTEALNVYIYFSCKIFQNIHKYYLN